MEGKIGVDEVKNILLEKLQGGLDDEHQKETGIVLSVGDSIARVYGLSSLGYHELVEFSSGDQGLALNLEEDHVGVVVLGSDRNIKEGDQVKRTGEIFSVPVGDTFLLSFE